ncbi:MAG: zf-HC2 domain-containing protein, partial [Candidatus Bathyarchaeota archaeon]
MEANNSSPKPPKKEDRDEIIGRALSRAIKESSKVGDCPSLEDISAFIDGKLDEKRRDELLGHLSYCDKCYEIFSTTHEAVKEEEISDLGYAAMAYVHEFDAEEVYAPIKKAVTSSFRKWILSPAPIAFAAAAVLIILFKFVIQPFIGYVPPSSDQIFNMLAKNTDAKTLAASIKEDRITSYAFTGVMPLEKASFRIGACLTDLEVSLRAEDKTMSLNLIKRIISILTPMEGSEDIVSFYGNMSGKVAEGISPKEFSGKSQEVESFFKDKNVFLYLRFG